MRQGRGSISQEPFSVTVKNAVDPLKRRKQRYSSTNSRSSLMEGPSWGTNLLVSGLNGALSGKETQRVSQKI